MLDLLAPPRTSGVRFLGSCLSTLLLAAPLAAQPMTARELLALPQPAPDTTIRYGADSLQFGELYLARGVRRAPVVVLIHGGCWLAGYDRRHIRSLAAAIATEGIAVWSLEYRRVGNAGGGWPGTFEDIGAGIDHVRSLAGAFDLDTSRVVVSGHSAGGHLALWAGTRGRLPAGSPGATAPLRPRGIVALAGVPDLAADFDAMRPGCGDAIVRLMGGHPDAVAERYRLGSPARWVPLGIRTTLVSGDGDRIVPPDLSRAYQRAAQAAGDDARLVLVANAGHFELVNPNLAGGRETIAAIKALLRP